MKKKMLISLGALLLSSQLISAQCASWVNSPKKDLAEESHVLYRQSLKAKDYSAALQNWQVAFDIAPAADGQRATHFLDGIEIYKHLFENETDEAKKDMYKKKAIELYDGAIECMKNKSIVYKNCDDQSCIDQRIGWIMGSKAYDMFYTFLYPRAETYAVLKESLKLTGNAAEYTVLYPYPSVVVYLFQAGKISKEEARDAYLRLNEIADYGAENHPTYGAYYQQAKDAIASTYSTIEGDIFDCDYFVKKHEAEYAADPTNVDLLRRIIVSLKQHGCQPGTTAFLDKVEAEYGQYAAAHNAAQQAEFEKNNPSIMAKRLFDEGDYSKAVAKYKEAIAAETDQGKQASYYFSIASIQFRQLGQYATARENAQMAAKLRSGWGRPYMLIGDMYAKSSSSCGSDAYSRGLAVLAAIDKWAYAKSIDSEVADEANKKIATYSDYIPPQDDAFMMGKKEGQSDQVACWIGETVRLRFN